MNYMNKKIKSGLKFKKVSSLFCFQIACVKERTMNLLVYGRCVAFNKSI